MGENTPSFEAGPTAAAQVIQTPSSAARRRRRRGRASALIGVALLLPIVVCAVAPGLFAPYPPLRTEVLARLEAPSGDHLFGTDELGRDVLSRVLYGARTSVISATITILVAALIGTPVGIIAGYSGGALDSVLMRLVDLALAFPALLLAIAVAAAAGSGILNAMLAVSLVWWPQYGRLVRGVTIAIRNRPFVEAAVVTGGTRFHIMRRHILPNIVRSVLIRMTLDLGYAILFLSSLGFVGLGERPPFPEWGSMLSTSRQYMLSYWWPAVFPALALTIVTLGITFLGDGLTDIMDPRLRRR